MKLPSAGILALLALAQAHPALAGSRFFFGGGPTGTSDYAFTGGWGGTVGIERRSGPAGSLLLRADGNAIPYGTPVPYEVVALDGLGDGRARSIDATLLNVLTGVRLGGSGANRIYLDALVGVGFMNDPENTLTPGPQARSKSRAATNIALSFGPGVEFRAPHLPGLFADAHYDFYFVEGSDTPLIPLRVGLMVP